MRSVMRGTGTPRRILAVGLLLGVGGLVGHGTLNAQEEKQEEKRPQETEMEEARAEADVRYENVMAALEQDNRFSGFLRMVEAAELEDFLREEDGITVFVPTNSALDQIGPPVLEETQVGAERVPPTDDRIRLIVQNHIVEDGAFTAAELAEKGHVTPLQRETTGEVETRALEIDAREGEVVIDGSVRIVEKDIRTGNGVIHVVNKTLLKRTKEAEKTPYDDTP